MAGKRPFASTASVVQGTCRVATFLHRPSRPGSSSPMRAKIAASFQVSTQEMKAFDERCYFTPLGADSAASLLEVDEPYRNRTIE
jgi:hypothetical protein